MRLFAALPLPPAAVERLTRLRLRLSAPKDGLRWSEPEQWHITLQFYDEVDEARAACLLAGLHQLKSSAPHIQLETFGLFGSKGILHVAVDPSPSLVSLQSDVLRSSEACGMLPESRPFRPHITLARSKGKPGNGTLRRLTAGGLPPFGGEISWHAPECLLIQSTLRPQGALYSVLARIPLNAGAAAETEPQ